jgi:hypothetical protein
MIKLSTATVITATRTARLGRRPRRGVACAAVAGLAIVGAGLADASVAGATAVGATVVGAAGAVAGETPPACRGNGGGDSSGSLAITPLSATAAVQPVPSQYRFSCRLAGSAYQPAGAVCGVVIASLHPPSLGKNAFQPGLFRDMKPALGQRHRVVRARPAHTFAPRETMAA